MRERSRRVMLGASSVQGVCSGRGRDHFPSFGGLNVAGLVVAGAGFGVPRLGGFAVVVVGLGVVTAAGLGAVATGLGVGATGVGNVC